MDHHVQILSAILLVTLSAAAGSAPAAAKPAPRGGNESDLYQACAVLTVSEGKRLIGRAVAQMPIVKKALAEGTVIVTTGTTNTYVAEELLGEKIEHGTFVTGKTYPAKRGSKLRPKGKFIRVIVIRKGKWVKEISLDEALEALKPGDVVIKGANALDYESRLAGVLIGHPAGGTIGKVMPFVVARKAHLVIPVGLEKLCPGSLHDLQNKMRQPIKTLGWVPSMFMVSGHIVTEVEALELLAGVEAFQAAAGGIGGAEGSRWIVFRGSKEKVEKARELVKSIQGEPPFVE